MDPTLSDDNLLTVTTKPFKQKYEASENVSEKSKDRGGKTKSSLNPSDLRICVFCSDFLGLPNIFVSELPGYWLVNLPPPPMHPTVNKALLVKGLLTIGFVFHMAL